jgi:hypothetical protein
MYSTKKTLRSVKMVVNKVKDIRLLSKIRIKCARQEVISEQQPAFTGVNEAFEHIFDEPSEVKVMALKEIYRFYAQCRA